MTQHASVLLIVTAAAELAIGVGLLIVPSLVIELLFGIHEAAAETLLVARFAGAALTAFGIAAWSARGSAPRGVLLGTVTAALIYDVAAAALLVYAALSLRMVGIALWPGVSLHSGLAIWCLLSLFQIRREAHQLHDSTSNIPERSAL